MACTYTFRGKTYNETELSELYKDVKSFINNKEAYMKTLKENVAFENEGVLPKEEGVFEAEPGSAEKEIIEPGLEIYRQALTEKEQKEFFEFGRSVLEKHGYNPFPQYVMASAGKLEWSPELVIDKDGKPVYRGDDFDKSIITYKKQETGSDGKEKRWTYHYYNSNFDGSPITPIPQNIINILEKITGQDMSDYDTVLINLYPVGRTLGWHQDVTEDYRNMDRDIVSVSIGADADFIYANQGMKYIPGEPKSGIKAPLAVSTGDVMTFGGPSRLISHTVTNVSGTTDLGSIDLSDSNVNKGFKGGLELNNWRMNFTFRVASPGNNKGKRKPTTKETSVVDITETYKGISVIDTPNIKAATGEPGAAKYTPEKNQILLNRELLKKKFDEKAWTKPRKQKDGSFATALPEDAFSKYDDWEKFVIEHEYQHSLLSFEQFGAKTVGEYEDEINRRALKEITPSTQSVTTQGVEKMSDLVNHSGGAYGGDTYWDIIGREFGVTQHMHYKDVDNPNLSQKLRNAGVKATILTDEQMNFARNEVRRLLGIDYSIKSTDTEKQILQKNLQVRNFYQVYNADAVYAIAKLDNSVDTSKPDNFTDITKSIKSYKFDKVKGGTNTAVQLGIKLNKPVYVWDITTEKWYKFDGTQFEEIETPTLTKNFAGVGSRDIENYNVQKEGKWRPREEYVGKEKEEKAKEAIRDVYANTLKAITKPTVSEAISPITFESAFTEDEQEIILKNFSKKHNMSVEQVLPFIKQTVAEYGQKAIDKLKECY
jgi:alkylated DNA repair dioxygenase AlkB